MPTDREIEIAGVVAQVYDWIDSQAGRISVQCDVCGKRFGLSLLSQQSE